MRRRTFARLALVGMVGSLCPSALWARPAATSIPLPDLARRWRLTRRWTEAGKEATLEGSGVRLGFTLHQRAVTVNGTRLWLGFPITTKGSELAVATGDVERTLAAILQPQQFRQRPALKTVVLDPGHGGRDTGAISGDRKSNEKTLVMDLAARLRRRLEGQGLKVVQTRTNDTFVELADRPAIAARLGGDLFLSLHFNAAAPAAKGIETFAFTPQHQPSTNRRDLNAEDAVATSANAFDVWNAVVGFQIQRAMLRNTNATDRGLKRARFTVLKTLRCPGVLIEGGFLTNPEELQRIRTSAYMDKLADGIAEGVRGYRTLLDRR